MTSFRYDVRNADIAKDLMSQGFTIYNTSPGIWTMEAPETMSNNKARKLISVCIELYTASKEMARATKNYEFLVNKINKINLSR